SRPRHLQRVLARREPAHRARHLSRRHAARRRVLREHLPHLARQDRRVPRVAREMPESPIALAFLATVGTYLLTAAGTLPVLVVREAPRRLMDAMMGLAGGIMVAASCWSLLIPAIEMGGAVRAAAGL